MQFKKVKTEINRIARIGNSKKTQDEVRELNQKLNTNRLELRKRGKRVYFYEMEDYYDKVKRRSNVKSTGLGGISKTQYKAHQQKIDEFLEQRKKQELIHFLAQL